MMDVWPWSAAFAEKRTPKVADDAPYHYMVRGQ